MRVHPAVAVLAVSLLFLPVTACKGGEGGGTAGFTVRDSAGVQIVENTAPQWKEGEGWTLSPEPSVDIGVVDGAPEYQLSRVTGALRLASGVIVVANGGTQDIRYYDAAGKHVRTIGGQGGGPGEFQFLSWIRGLHGDSLLAYDMLQQRLSTFDPEGILVGTKAFETKGPARLLELFPDGTLLVRASNARPASEVKSGARRDSMFLFRTSTDGLRLNSIVGLRGQESFVRTGKASISVAPALFGRSSMYSLAGKRVFAADNDIYEIRALSIDGKLERLIRRSAEARPVTQDDVDRVKRQRLEDIDNPGFRKQVEAMLAEMSVSATMPAFADLRADEAGNLWVQEYVEPGVDGPWRWTVFDPDGRMLGEVSMPSRFRPMQIGSDLVLGAWTDDLDVEHVRMYALTKAGSSTSAGEAADR